MFHKTSKNIRSDINIAIPTLWSPRSEHCDLEQKFHVKIYPAGLRPLMGTGSKVMKGIN